MRCGKMTTMAGVAAAAMALAAPAAHARSGAYHLMAPPSAIAAHHVPHATAQAGAQTMLYYGGPVLAQVKIVAVIWNKSVAGVTKANIGGFLSSIVNSTYVDQWTQYDTSIKGVGGIQGTDQSIVRGTYLGRFILKPKNTSTSLSDGDVQTELLAQIAAGKLPPSDLNTLYMIYFPSNISISLDGGLSCQSFGAYHFATSATISPTNVFYGVMPDCGGGFTSQTIDSSHEYAEATTDAIPTPGSSPAYPQAWNTSNGYEIGDLCEGTSAKLKSGTKTYTVQEVFDNKTNACATGNFTSP